MSKALVFAGAFNPPSIAHLECAKMAMDAVGFEKVIFVPSKARYITAEQKKNMAFSDKERLEMLRKLAKTRPWMVISDFELISPAQPRTYITLKEMRRKGFECKLLMGSDKLPELENGWLFVDEIAKEFGIVVIDRNHDDCQAIIDKDPYLSSLKPYITLAKMPVDYQVVSSTSLRQALRQVKDGLAYLEGALPEELHYLYKDTEEKP